MSNARLETWIWVLIYGGLLALVVGGFVAPGDAALGGTMMVAGALTALAGAVLVWVRSRIKDES